MSVELVKQDLLPELRLEHLPQNAYVHAVDGAIVQATITPGYDFAIGESERRNRFDLGVLGLVAVGANQQELIKILGADEDAMVHSRLGEALRRYGIISPARAMQGVQTLFNCGLFRPYVACDNQDNPILRHLPPVHPGVLAASDMLMAGRNPRQIPTMRQHEYFRQEYGLPNAVAARSLLLTGQAAPIERRHTEALRFNATNVLAQTGKSGTATREVRLMTLDERVAEAQETFIANWSGIQDGREFSWRGAVCSLELPSTKATKCIQAITLYSFGYTREEVAQALGQKDKQSPSSNLSRGRRLLGFPENMSFNLLPFRAIKQGLAKIHEYADAPDFSDNPDALSVLCQKAYFGDLPLPPELGISPGRLKKLLRSDLYPVFNTEFKNENSMIMGAAACGLVFREYTSRTLRNPQNA